MPSVMTIIAAATAVLAATQGHAEELRAIKGPLPPPDLPPFAVTAAVVLLAASGTAVWRWRKGGRHLDAPPAPPDAPLDDEIDKLRELYCIDMLSEGALFERLSTLLRGSLTGGDPIALTNTEIVSAAGRIHPAERLERAAALLELCDTVRFGNVRPPKDVALIALDDAADALRQLQKR